MVVMTRRSVSGMQSQDRVVGWGHSSFVFSVSFSPDGRRIVSGSGTGRSVSGMQSQDRSC